MKALLQTAAFLTVLVMQGCGSEGLGFVLGVTCLVEPDTCRVGRVMWEIVGTFPAIVTGLSPADGAVLDNADGSDGDVLEWHFDWSDVRGADRYDIHCRGPGDTDLLFDTQGLTASQYYYTSPDPIAPSSLQGWEWRVRARSGSTGQWTMWTVHRFSVRATGSAGAEPADTYICPARSVGS